jgi:menaquinone-dependent protoporphyrinogen oxidase
MKILVLYHSYDNQTARIATRMGDVIGAYGHSVTMHRFDGPGALDRLRTYDAVVIGAAIRYGHHERALEKEVARHAVELVRRPNAFFSVCLSAGGPGYKPQACERYIDQFCEKTGWEPREVASFAGALQWSKYHNPFIKFMMKLIVGYSGGETDSSRDYEYTDWVAVERFARGFAERLAPQPEARAA